MYSWSVTILLSFLASSATLAPAQDDPILNHREKCRRTVSGAYATAVADAAMAEDSVKLAETAKKKAQAVIDVHEAKLRLVNRRLKERDYPNELLAERDSLVAQVKLYHEQFVTSEAQLADARKSRDKTRKTLEQLKRHADLIFNVYFTEDPDGLPRKLFNKLEWKSECPKYRALCPLPHADAEKLIALIDHIDDRDLACYRYAKLK